MRFSLKALQEQPEDVRVKIMWTVTAIIGVAILAVWLVSTKNQIQNTDTSDLSFLTGVLKNETTTDNQYINAEWIERSNGKLKVYFKVNNPTNSILNFSKSIDVSLKIGDQTQVAEELKNRQESQFVQKILSNSTEYGVVVFTDIPGDRGEITFGQLFFENQEQTIFTQKADLNLKELNKPLELRS
ncbi:MAG TPA: hypothetical protein VD998_03675 [Verrucomicrobiae bacterium]|nr:hypothetical protein [Verrucomicrobiae bacterium]